MPDQHANQSIQTLADYIKRMALQHEFEKVENCMSFVDKLYKKGDPILRNAIENIFVFSFSSLQSACNVEWRIIQSYMPADLYALYVKQILKSRC